jgi:hypothetical protein
LYRMLNVIWNCLNSANPENLLKTVWIISISLSFCRTWRHATAVPHSPAYEQKRPIPAMAEKLKLKPSSDIRTVARMIYVRLLLMHWCILQKKFHTCRKRVSYLLW